MNLTNGTRLGPYEILAPLGAGGMGEVYKAKDTRLDRTVAIKVLPPHIAGQPEARQRFEREARAVSSLNHPHICTLHDIGRQDGIDFLVMEYLEGESLAHRLAAGPLPVEQALRYAVQIAEALAEAHRHGIFHRDLKPGNIMLTKSGAKLLDFGLAKMREAAGAAAGLTMMPTQVSPAQANLTQAGAILGTVQYMAPEQLEGKDADARSDIFAFGAVVYEMLTGRKAFPGTSAASVIGSIMTAQPAPISSVQPVAPALDRIVQKCLAKDPAERWQTAQDLASELKWTSEGASQLTASVTLPSSAVATPARSSNRERLAWAAALALATLGAVTLGIVHFRETPPRQPVVRFHVPLPEKVAFREVDVPVISPDGERLAFTALSADRIPLLWVRPLDSLEAQPLPGTEGAFLPFWSPDSRSIAFFAQGSLRRVDLAGGSALTLCAAPAGRGGAWNAEGVIIFAPAPASPLQQVAANGGEPKPVTTLDTTRQETAHLYPTLLPDGRHFLYLALAGMPGVNLSSLGSPESRRLFNTDRNVQFASPDQVLFLREGALMSQRFDTRSFELAGDAAPVARQVAMLPAINLALFSASQTGVLAYRTGTGITRARLLWLDRSGKELGTIGENGDYSNPALSPDEKRLAVGRRDPRSGTRDIWVFDLTRGTSSRLTFDPADDTNPSWSPDGNWIAFTSDRKGERHLYRKLASGTGEEEVLWELGERKSVEDWSNDGRTILFNNLSPKRPADVWALPLEGDRKATPVLSAPFAEDQAQLSPDGRWIAYRSYESGRYEVYVQSFPPSGGKWQISTAGGNEPQWRRDGKELFYTAPGNKLMAVEVRAGGALLEAGIPKELFEFRGGPVFRNRYAVAGNGERFLVVALDEQTSSAPITVVLNWQAGPRR
jgi:serine/threonine protein kinase